MGTSASLSSSPFLTFTEMSGSSTQPKWMNRTRYRQSGETARPRVECMRCIIEISSTTFLSSCSTKSLRVPEHRVTRMSRPAQQSTGEKQYHFHSTCTTHSILCTWRQSSHKIVPVTLALDAHGRM